MFWGIREAKRVQLLTVDKPRVDVELAGNILKSRRIGNMTRNSNFEEPLQYMDVELPENELYWPPITIRCVDCRNFGREVILSGIVVKKPQLSETTFIGPSDSNSSAFYIQRVEHAGLSRTPLPCACTCTKGWNSCIIISIPCSKLLAFVLFN